MPTSPASPAVEVSRVRASMLRALWRAPWFSEAFGRVTLEADTSIETFAISASGRVRFNPDLSASLPIDQLGGIMAHEVSHPLLAHFQRTPPGADPSLWNQAGDAVINAGLIADGFALPEWVVTPESLGYSGPLITELIYAHLAQQAPKDQPQPKPGKGKGQGQGAPKVGAGCGMEGPEGDQPGAGDGDQPGPAGKPGKAPGAPGKGAPAPAWGDVAERFRGACRMAGKGSGIAESIAPAKRRASFADVLRTGADVARAVAGRDHRTYARASRRASGGDFIRPGYQGSESRIAIVIDVSGSMNREWVSAIAGEIVALAKARPDARIFVVSHTSRVVWSGWVTPRSVAGDMALATAHTGGTDADPAYALVAEEAKRGKFDALIHFTDCELCGSVWPTVPAKRLIVGAFGSGAYQPYTRPPQGALVIPCEGGADLARVA